MSRVRIRIMQRDGTCPRPDEAAAVHDARCVPFPRGRDVKVSVVADDGSETPLLNVKRLTLRARGRTDAVTCVLELYNPIVDIEVPATFEDSNETNGDFLGMDRTILP